MKKQYIVLGRLAVLIVSLAVLFIVAQAYTTKFMDTWWWTAVASFGLFFAVVIENLRSFILYKLGYTL